MASRGPTPDLREVLAEPDGSGGSVGYRRRRRRFLRRFPWWVSVGFDRLSTGVVVLVMLVGLVTVSLVGVRYFLVDRGDDVDDAVLASSVSVDYEGEFDSRFGQEIPPLKRLRWERFGRPLHIGPRGIPLIESAVSGEVREMTDMEMSFPHDVDYRRDPNDRSIVLAPGPTGYAVRWWLPETYEELPKARAFDRVGWFVAHESRLEAAVGDISLGLFHISRNPPTAWDRRWGEELVAISDAVTDTYAYGNPDYWTLVPGLLYCSSNLESVYRSGVTEGCPSKGYQDTVAVIWRDLGRIVDVMDRLGKSAMLQSHHQVGHLFRDEDLGEYRVKQLELMQSALLEVRESFDLLKEYGNAEGYYIQVNLP